MLFVFPLTNACYLHWIAELVSQFLKLFRHAHELFFLGFYFGFLCGRKIFVAFITFFSRPKGAVLKFLKENALLFTAFVVSVNAFCNIAFVQVAVTEAYKLAPLNINIISRNKLCAFKLIVFTLRNGFFLFRNVIHVETIDILVPVVVITLLHNACTFHLFKVLYHTKTNLW